MKARFDKDYTAIQSPCAVYTDEFSFTEYYDVGDYEKLKVKATDVYLDGGYKLTVFSGENFTGKQTKVYYSGKFNGFIGSIPHTHAYDAQKHLGEGIGSSSWNRNFVLDCFTEGGGVTIWGNKGRCPPIQIYPRMDAAPSGPQHKQSLNNYYTFNGHNE